MDPYRLGSKMDKMTGLIDWEAAFRGDVCLIEWPDKMPRGQGWDSVSLIGNVVYKTGMQLA